MTALVLVAAKLSQNRLETYLPMKYVRVEGSIWNLDMDAFEQTLAPYTHSGYFSTDMERIETEAKTFAWVDRVRVERLWPDTLVVRIEEQKPIARWDGDSLLNDRGERFTPPSVADYQHLPRLSGPEGQEKLVLGTLRALNAKLERRNLRIVTLSLSKRRAWVARLENGVEIVFGHQDPLAALERTLSLLPRLGEDRIAAIQKLDLRYPNGFSVIWKPLEPEPPPTGNPPGGALEQAPRIPEATLEPKFRLTQTDKTTIQWLENRIAT